MARTRDCAKGRNFAVAYLNVLIDDADEEELTAALGRIARASGGPKLVEKVELNAPSFYRTLCRRGNPELKSVAALLKAMGIRLALQPLGERKPYLEISNRDAEDTAYYTDPEVDLIASPAQARGKMTRKDGTPH
jgi:probable addiction module antidote protein